MTPPPLLLLLFFFRLLLPVCPAPLTPLPPPPIISLRHLPSIPPFSSLDHRHLLLELRRRDAARLRFLSHRLLLGSPAAATKSSNDLLTPVASGAATGAGQYFIEFALGTPPQKLWLIADTGSDLIWVRCAPCTNKLRCGVTITPLLPPPPASNSSRTFDAGSSSTYRPILCFSQACLLVPAPPRFSCNLRIPTTCSYQYAYTDTSFTVGIFSRDTVTLNASGDLLRQLQVQEVAFGCGVRNEGQSFVGSDGVLGLGRGPISFISQVAASSGGAAKFAYCLADFFALPAQNSFLLLGSELPAASPAAKQLNFKYTPLLQNPFAPSLYYVGVEAVRVAGVTLTIPGAVWQIDTTGSGGGGTVVDSGTTLTAFVEPAYQAILQAMEGAVKLPRVGGAPLGFDLCVNVSGALPGSLPELMILMGGGAEFRPPPDGNVFIDVPLPGVKCLGMRSMGSTTTGFSVLGNLIQQNFHMVFDIDNGRLGFAPAQCSSLLS